MVARSLRDPRPLPCPPLVSTIRGQQRVKRVLLGGVSAAHCCCLVVESEAALMGCDCRGWCILQRLAPLCNSYPLYLVFPVEVTSEGSPSPSATRGTWSPRRRRRRPRSAGAGSPHGRW